MKYTKKTFSTITSIAIISQILLNNYILINAQTDNTNYLQTQKNSLESSIAINGLFIKATPPQINELYKSKIILFGCDCKKCNADYKPRHKFEISFDCSNKKLIVDDLAGVYDNHPFNPSFGNKKYLSVQLIDEKGKVKKELSMTGNDNVKKSLELNNVGFEYGDTLRIYHAEANDRTKINGNVYDINGKKLNLTEGTSSDILNKYDFKITNIGLQEIYKSGKYPFITGFNGNFEEITTATGSECSLWNNKIKPKYWEVQNYKNNWNSPKGEIVSESKSGKNAVKLILENSVGFFKTITNSSPKVEPGKDYKLSTYIKTENLETKSTKAPILIKVDQLDKNNTLLESKKIGRISKADDWTNVCGTIKANKYADKFRIVVQIDEGLKTPVSGNVYLDEFTLEKLN